MFLNGLKKLLRVFIFNDSDTSISVARPITFTRTVIVPNDTIAYAKMQNVSATDKVLGRLTAGAGDIEEIACTSAGRALIDDASAAAQLITLGITPTAAQINLLTQGIAAGYKIARGTITPVSGQDTVVTGLATVVAAVASLKGAPTLTCMFVAADIGNQAGSPAAGSIYIKSYKPTATGDVTPIASTTPWSAIDWIAIGT